MKKKCVHYLGKMYYSRNIDSELENWKQLSSRKPLILRGARQVGKSSAIRNLASLFVHFVKINFDETPEKRAIFQSKLSSAETCQQLAVVINTPIEAGKTPLFLDEIQASIPAIRTKRYFYEKISEIPFSPLPHTRFYSKKASTYIYIKN